jgi:hypothetical protein
MILNVIVDEQTYPLEVPEFVLAEADELFDKMDADMSKGWQMSREWVDNPTNKERCQIAADRLLTALENENQSLATMMAGYIIKRMPGVKTVRIDAEGDITLTELYMS